IYSNDPTTGKPSISSGPIMNLSGESNPIKFIVVSNTYARPVKWVPATRFILAANQCYWAVLSAESGEVIEVATDTTPAGSAGSLGRACSTDAGVTWIVDSTSNRQMLIKASPVVSSFSGPEMAADG